MLLSQLIYEGGGPCLARQVMHRVGLPDNGTVTPLTRSLSLCNGYSRHSDNISFEVKGLLLRFVRRLLCLSAR